MISRAAQGAVQLGPCRRLALAVLQSTMYADYPDIRRDVDAVLAEPAYDTAPGMLDLLRRYVETATEHDNSYTLGLLDQEALVFLAATEYRPTEPKATPP